MRKRYVAKSHVDLVLFYKAKVGEKVYIHSDAAEKVYIHSDTGMPSICEAKYQDKWRAPYHRIEVITVDQIVEYVFELPRNAEKVCGEAGGTGSGANSPVRPVEGASPRWAELLVTSVLPSARTEEVLGDLEEQLLNTRAQSGRFWALLTYWVDAVRIVGSILVHERGKAGRVLVVGCLRWFLVRIGAHRLADELIAVLERLAR